MPGSDPVGVDVIADVLRRENPWWAAPHRVPSEVDALRPRAALATLVARAQARSPRRAIVLLGPRRVGKTVLLLHAVRTLIERGVDPRAVLYVALDHPVHSVSDLTSLLARYEATARPPPQTVRHAFFDEIQYLPEWERHLKRLVDERRDVQVVVSGSAATALRLQGKESGAGRFTELVLPPLTFHEFLDLRSESAMVEASLDEKATESARASSLAALNDRFVDYVNHGGYPEVALAPAAERDAWTHVHADIIEKVLLRDLPGLYGVQDPRDLNFLFTRLAFNTAREIGLETISKDAGIAKNTVGRYLEFLEAAFLLRRIDRVDLSARRFRRPRTFKTFLTTSSLWSALFTPQQADDPTFGSLVETAIVAQAFHGRVDLRFARWRAGRSDREIDLVTVDPLGRPTSAVEIKWSDRAADPDADLRALVDFCRLHRLDDAVVTTRSVRASRDVDGVRVRFVPAALHCHEIGQRTTADARPRTS